MDSATQAQDTGWWTGLELGALLFDCRYPGGAEPKKTGALWVSEHRGDRGLRYAIPRSSSLMYSEADTTTLLWIPFASVTGIHVGASTERRTTGTRALAGGIVGLAATKAFQWTSVEITEPGVSTVILSRDPQPYVLDKLRPILDAFEHRETAEGTPGETPPNDTTALIADELEKLASLRDRGVLTSEEFDERKAKLLAQ